MAGISFSVFKDKILDGSKRQTIRGIRKNPIKEGETLYLWWKQRSPEREKLGEAKCLRATPIKIYSNGFEMPYLSVEIQTEYPAKLLSDRALIEQAEILKRLDGFAIRDGFDNWQQLIEYFDSIHGLPFTGVLIQWDNIIRDTDPELVEALNDWSDRTDYRGNDDNGSLRVQVQIC